MSWRKWHSRDELPHPWVGHLTTRGPLAEKRLPLARGLPGSTLDVATGVGHRILE